MTGFAEKSVVAFDGDTLIASGPLVSIVRAVKEAADEGGTILIFDKEDSRPVEVDLRGGLEDVLDRLGNKEVPDSPPPKGRGRPKLGVVGREVTLLPRHWEWLSKQPGGASVALRKLVEDARRTQSPEQRARQAKDAVYRFMLAIAGDFPGYEEALRALFADHREKFNREIEDWPHDIRGHVEALAANAFVVTKRERRS